MKEILKKIFDVSTIKFITVGIINTLVGTAVMLLLYNLAGAGYWFSSAMNYIVGSIVSYFLNKNFTFQYKEKDARSVLKFAANITICYLLAYGGAKQIVFWMLRSFSDKIRDNVSMLVGMCFFVGLNYLGQKFIVFAKRDKERETH